MKKNLLVTFVGILVIFLPHTTHADEIPCAIVDQAQYDNTPVYSDPGFGTPNIAYQPFQVAEECTVTSVGFVGFVSGDTNNPLDVIIYDQTNDINVANAAAGINNWPFGSGSAAFVNVDNWLTDLPVLEPGIQY